MNAKAGDQGGFTPESIWLAWREWDFGQTREPPARLTPIAQRKARRMNTL